MIPQTWLAALEDADDHQPLFSSAHIAALGYLPADPDDTSGLPIGFAIDRSDARPFIRSRLQWFRGQRLDQPWVGMTCAACHTGEVRYNGQRVAIVDGGPGNGDFQTLIERLDRSAQATLRDNAKFARFAAAVRNSERSIRPGGGTPSTVDDEMLRQALTAFVAWEGAVAQRNNPGGTVIRYGKGRLDAFGHIFNKVTLIVQNDGDQPFASPADAPVSYPFLWNIHQHDRVQWNGIAPNKGLKLPGGVFDVGAIGRNTGEVVGVFADVRVPAKYPGLRGYGSSVHVGNLDAIEDQLRRLLPPTYPSTFPPRFADPAKERALIGRGRDLFVAKCRSCHELLPKETLLSAPIAAAMTPIWGTADKRPVGTDPWMACNAFTYRMLTGKLNGTTPAGYLGNGAKFGAIADDREILTTVVAGTLAQKKRELVKAFGRAFFGLPRPIETVPGGLPLPERAQKTKLERLDICKQNAGHALMAYKGRPLNGIWATGPFLHNGSVRTLYQLLLDPAARERSFAAGGRDFDPVEVGFVGGPEVFRARDANGVPIERNSNEGHDYDNRAMSDDDRWAIVEFMKTL